MSRFAQITALSASIDTTLTQFAGLMPNEAGEYPWQQAQRERRNRRIAGAVGATAIGAGAYGVKKGMGALNKRYGTQGTDGVKAGAADLINRADDAMKGGVAKVKSAAAPVIDKAKAMAAPVMGAVKRKWNAGKVSYGRGMAQKQGLGKMVGRVARAVVHASRADQLIALEAKLDSALEFTEAEKKESKPWPRHRMGLPAGMVATGVGSFLAGKAVGKHGVKGVVAKAKRFMQKPKAA